MEDPLFGVTLKALDGRSSGLLLTDSPKEAHQVHKEWDWLQLLNRVVYQRGPSNEPEDK